VAQNNKAVSKTDAERRFKQKPYLSCDLRFSTRSVHYARSIWAGLDITLKIISLKRMVTHFLPFGG